MRGAISDQRSLIFTPKSAALQISLSLEDNNIPKVESPSLTPQPTSPTEAGERLLLSSEEGDIIEVDQLNLTPKYTSSVPQELVISTMRELKSKLEEGPIFDPPSKATKGDPKDDDDEDKKKKAPFEDVGQKIKLAPPKMVRNDPKIKGYKSMLQNLEPEDPCYTIAVAANDAIQAALRQKLEDPLKIAVTDLQGTQMMEKYIVQIAVLEKKLEAYESYEGPNENVEKVAQCETKREKAERAVEIQRAEIRRLQAALQQKNDTIDDLNRQIKELIFSPAVPDLADCRHRNDAEKDALKTQIQDIKDALRPMTAINDVVGTTQQITRLQALEQRLEALELTDLITVEECQKFGRGLTEELIKHKEELKARDGTILQLKDHLDEYQQELNKCRAWNKGLEGPTEPSADSLDKCKNCEENELETGALNSQLRMLRDEKKNILITKEQCKKDIRQAVAAKDERIRSLNTELQNLQQTTAEPKNDKSKATMWTEQECEDRWRGVLDEQEILIEKIQKLEVFYEQESKELTEQLTALKKVADSKFTEAECDERNKPAVDRLKNLKEEIERLRKEIKNLNKQLAEASKKQLKNEERDAMCEDQINDLKAQIKKLEEDAEGLVPIADADRAVQEIRDQAQKFESEAMEAEPKLAEALTGKNMVTLEHCIKRNKAEVDRLTADITRITEAARIASTAHAIELVKFDEALKAAKEGTGLDTDEAKTLRERIAELDREALGYRRKVEELEAQIQRNGSIEGEDLKRCKREKARLEAHSAALTALVAQQKTELDKPNSRNEDQLQQNVETLKKRATDLRDMFEEAQEKQKEAERGRIEMDAQYRALGKLYIDLETEVERMNAEILVLRGNDADQKLKECWQLQDTLKEKLGEARREWAAEQSNRKIAEGQIKELKEEKQIQRKNLEQLDDLAKKQTAELNKIKSEGKDNDALSKCNKKFEDLEELAESLKAQITTLTEQLQTAEGPVDHLTALLEAMKNENKRLEKQIEECLENTEENSPQNTAELERLKKQYAKMKKLLDDLKRRYIAIQEQNNKTDTFNRSHQELLSNAKTPFTKLGSSIQRNSDDDYDTNFMGSASKEPKSSLEVELAILRAQTELAQVITRRGVTGFVYHDTELARQAIIRALEMVSELPETGRNTQLHAEAQFWNFLVLYYSDKLYQAAGALAVADGCRVHLTNEEERDSLMDWTSLSELPPCPKSANVYAAGANNRQVQNSDSDPGSKKESQNRKKSKRRRRRNETSEERKERGAKRQQQKKDEQDKENQESTS